MIDVILFDMKLQLEKNRAEQIEKYYPNLICTQSLGHVRNMSSYIYFLCAVLILRAFTIFVLLN